MLDAASIEQAFEELPELSRLRGAMFTSPRLWRVDVRGGELRVRARSGRWALGCAAPSLAFAAWGGIACVQATGLLKTVATLSLCGGLMGGIGVLLFWFVIRSRGDYLRIDRSGDTAELPRAKLRLPVSQIEAIEDVGARAPIINTPVSELGVIWRKDGELIARTVVGAHSRDGVSGAAAMLARFLDVPLVVVRDYEGSRSVRVVREGWSGSERTN